MLINRSSFGIACRVVACSFLMAGTASLLQAQQSQSAVPGVTSDASSLKAPVLLASGSAPANLTSSSEAFYSSSTSSDSSSAAAASDSATRFDLGAPAALDSSQPPPRRRYGRPNYSDSHSNPDGSDKYFFLAGVGLTLPVGDTHSYDTPSYDFQFGGGRNFNKNVGIGLQFDYDHFGLQGSTLANQTTIYDYLYRRY
jgi:hypothetical protein